MSKHNIEKEIKNIEKLRVLSVCDKRSKKKILSKADRDLICVLKDCILNVFLGNIKLSQAEKNQLQTHKFINHQASSIYPSSSTILHHPTLSSIINHHHSA